MVEKPMHSLLRRQLKRCFGNTFTIPKEWESFIETVNEAYKENDVDRGMLERSLELSSHELLQTNSEMRAVIHAFPDILFRLSSDGTILDYKTGFSTDLLLIPESYRGKRIQDLSEKAVGEKFNEAIIQLNETKAMVSIEYPLTIRGKEEYFEARLVPLLENQLFVIIRNVSQIREIQEELRRFTVELETIVAARTRELTEANERLQELDKLKTDFISSVSHELRTPLTAVVGFMHIIEDRLGNVIFPLIESDTPKVRKAITQVKTDIDIIQSEGERLTLLINDVLDITKMESGNTDWKMERLDINEVIEHAIAATGSLLRQKQLPLTLDLYKGSHFIHGDRDRLIQVMINLISNAVKFTDKGQIRIKTERNGKGIIVKVMDTGVGIDPTHHLRIFEKFRQVGDTLTDKPRGTGLGLPICKHIIERHNGRIWVESTPGKGSVFSFVIPFSIDDTQGLNAIKVA